MSDLIAQALYTLHCIEQDKLRCEHVNDEIQAWQQDDFAARLHSITPAVEKAVMDTLDLILGDSIASYYLYEATHMQDGGKIIEADKSEWLIRDISDVGRYVRRRA